MANRDVHWHEGMFLRQHHFLSGRRESLRVGQLNAKWDAHYNWGLRSIKLDADGLGNFRFSVSSLEARLRDGTLVQVPDDGQLQELDLKPALEANRRVTVHLAVPVVKSGRANVSEAGPSPDARYHLVTQEVEDENTGTDPQLVTFRRPNLRLLLSTQDLTGYTTLPIARVERTERAEATPQLDPTYFPSMLACDAWYDLQVGVLQAVYDRVGRKIEKLAGQAVSRGLTLDSRAQDTVHIFGQLRELNEAYATLANLAFIEGVHPLTVYVELCRLVGQLAVFDPTRRPPAIPRYNHDDLGGCFYRLKHHLDHLLSIVPEPDYQERPFIGAGLRMQVSLERAWLDETARMFIGVHCTLDPEEVVRLMKPGALDMKVGSSERVEAIFRMGETGLKFAPAPNPPPALPRDPGLTYFQVSRDQADEEWKRVERSLTLAIRLNEELVTGSIDRQQLLHLRFGGTETSLRFTLYILMQAVPPAPAAVAT
jgi:type VI secretion system protein ImpJ